ncbi:MAG: hypothetical protein E4H19_08045 [Chromatiales bacterium]|jgi:hypothetical protein|nr:MAG: hypothetical protein E4H19_08045 [Chromatiales bacterium]
MSSTPDQQPIQRTVGRRTSREGQPLTDPARAEDRAAMTRNARYRTRAPKGVFYYASHEDMAADRLRWTIDLMAERAHASTDQSR